VRRIGDALDGTIGRGSPKQDVLKEVFRLNHAMGRMARESPSLGPALRDIQLEVNFMTIHIKRNELDLAKERFGRLASRLGDVSAADAAAAQG
jgi:hypothetical protein